MAVMARHERRIHTCLLTSVRVVSGEIDDAVFVEYDVVWIVFFEGDILILVLFHKGVKEHTARKEGKDFCVVKSCSVWHARQTWNERSEKELKKRDGESLQFKEMRSRMSERHRNTLIPSHWGTGEQQHNSYSTNFSSSSSPFLLSFFPSLPREMRLLDPLVSRERRKCRIQAREHLQRKPVLLLSLASSSSHLACIFSFLFIPLCFCLWLCVPWCFLSLCLYLFFYV